MKKGIDYIGVTCVFYCHDGKGKLLLHQRSNKCKDEQGKWDCGGGSLEFGEEFEEGLRREIKEEYGTDVLDLTFVTVTNVLRHNREHIPTHWIALLFAVKIDPAKVKIVDPEKMTRIGWFKPSEFPEPRHSMLMRHFNLVKKDIENLL
jgi:8-oxo-dGTP diphosphatase